MTYPRLDIAEFGHHLFETGDLDPIYVALNRLNWSQPKLDRWLVAYWCFYHAGFACYAAEHKGIAYWQVLAKAAENEPTCPVGVRWPRGTERRHFRGQLALEAVAK